MQEVVIRGSEFESKKDFHDYMKKEMNFPDYYGSNLSALYDVLTDLCDDTRIVLELCETEDEEMLEFLEKVAEVITDAAEENTYLEFECIEDI